MTGVDSELSSGKLVALAAKGLLASGLPIDAAMRLLNWACSFAVALNADGHIIAASDNTSTMLGYPGSRLLECKLTDLVCEQDRDALARTLQAGFRDGEALPTNLQFTKGLNECIWLQLRILAVDGEGVTPFLIVVGYDISAWKVSEDRMIHQALRDPLTGLGNRASMREQMCDAIQDARYTGNGIAVAVLNVDGFRRINDSLGHEVGDAVLRAVGKRLTGALRTEDSVARLGGDDFVILLPGIGNAGEVSIIARRLLTAVRQPLPFDGRQLILTASVGIAIYPQHGDDEVSLLKNADLAMYRAKQNGRDTYCLYTDDLGAEKQRELSVEISMFEAIRNGEFTLHYQPICATTTRDVYAVESLMRWTHNGKGVSPADFIPLAEENGLIHLLGGWALRTAAMQLARWDRSGISLAYMTVNVSPVQFLHPSLPSTIRKALTDSGIDPGRLVLEITESAVMRDPDKAKAVFEEIETMGIRFAIDDFGTGYSNLGNLKRFPLTCLKIDRSFIRDTPGDAEDCALVSMVLVLARELGLEAVAEGVETEEQMAFLAERGCRFIQGIAKALPPEVFEESVVSGKLRLHNAGSTPVLRDMVIDD